MHLFPRHVKAKAGVPSPYTPPSLGGAELPSRIAQDPTITGAAEAPSSSKRSPSNSPNRRVYLTTLNRSNPLQRTVRDVSGRPHPREHPDANKKKDEDLELVNGCAPNTQSFNDLLAQTGKGNKRIALLVMERMKRERVPCDQTTYNLLLEKVVNLHDDLCFHIYEEFKEEAQRDDAAIRPDLHTFELLISACERNGNYAKAFQLYTQMKDLFGLHPDVGLYNTLLGYCAPMHDEVTASFIVEEMRDRCIEPDAHTYNCLMNVFRAAPYEVILQTFEDMKKRKIKPNRRTYNTLMKACQQTGDYERAFEFFEELKKEGLTPDVISYNILLDLCKRRLDFALGVGEYAHLRKTREQKEVGMKAVAELSFGLFGEMEQTSVLPNTFTYNALLGVLCRCRDVRVYDVFAQMKEDRRSETQQISWQSDGPQEAEDWIVRNAEKMDVEKLLQHSSHQRDDGADHADEARIGARHVAPNHDTYTTLLEASEVLGLPDKAYALFDELKERGIKPGEKIYIKMMDVCAIRAEKARAFAIFEEAKSAMGQSLTIQVQNALMNVLAECSDPQIFDLFKDFQKDVHVHLSIRPDQDSYNILLKACCKLQNFDRAMQLYQDMCDPLAPVHPDAVSYGYLMDLCAARKDVPTAASLILDMKNRNVASTVNTYTRLMNVYVQAGDSGVIEVFESMRANGPAPNLDAYTTLLSFYLQRKDEAILTLFEDMKKAGVEPDVHAYNIMLQYCAELGSHQKSFKYFEELKVRGLNADIDTYNALIAVFAPSGSEFIFKVFEEMAECHVAPDHVTFATLMKHKAGRSCLATAADRHLILTDAKKLLQ